MLIVQISDLHIAAPGRKTYGIAPMAENLTRCVAHINQICPSPALVMVSGDICDTGAIEEAARAANILDQLHMPYFVIPGNHDVRENLWSVFGGTACPARDGSFINYDINLKAGDLEFEDLEPRGREMRDQPTGPRLIAVDSTIPDQPGGELCAQRLAWLDQQIAAAPTRPTLIFMHHAPVHCGVRESDIDGFKGADELGAIIGKYENIERIACGHIHLTTHTLWNRTIITTAPSMGMQLVLDLTKANASQFVLENPGYLLHHFVPGKATVTHAVYIQDRDGPYSFADQLDKK